MKIAKDYKPRIDKLARNIRRDMSSAESYNTGLVGEQLIVTAYKQMKTSDLVKLREILNGIIRKRVKCERIIENTQNNKLQ